MLKYTGFIITKSLVSIVNFKIYKTDLKKKLPKYFQKKKILNILHISMKLIRMCVICVDMYVRVYVSNFFFQFLVTDLMYDCVVLIFQQVRKATNKKQTKKRHQVL